ncbi:DUF1800 domain-containing protein [bacterium]|nr:DUF1800 domain-containing protein [bacterium]
MCAYLDPLPPSQWDRRKARHLLNRAGFGIPPRVVDSLADQSIDEAIDAFISFEQFEDEFEEPTDLPDPVTRDEFRMYRGMSEDERRNARRERMRDERQAMERLKIWWLERMRHSKRPLVEKMALFWHGHFATSAEKVKSSRFNYELNQVFRQRGLGNFRHLVSAVGQTPAMLEFLDNRQNRKGHANENWARELMELFTLGEGHYTEEDIKEAARAFTGYTHLQGEFVYNERQHDDGVKTVLGQTGKLNADDVLDILFEQPALAPFICRKIWEYFVYENPDEKLIEELSIAFRASKYELRPLMRTIFRSQEFYSAKAIGSQIKSPAQFVVMLVEQLNIQPRRGRLLTLAMAAMEQNLFYPPNVKGWPGGRHWINANTILVRYNAAGYAVTGQAPDAAPRQLLDETNEQFERRRRFFERAARRAPFDVADFFASWKSAPIGVVLDDLGDYFLGRSLDAKQRAELLQVISSGGNETTLLSTKYTDEDHLRAAVHLLLSMAEYQLC